MVRVLVVGLCLLATVGCRGVLRDAVMPSGEWGSSVAQPLTQATPAYSPSEITDVLNALQGKEAAQGQRWRAWRRDLSRREAMDRIGRIGGWAVPQLVERMRHRDREARRAAAVGFACVWARGDPAHVRPSMAKPRIHADFTRRAVEALSVGLSDVDDQVRMSSAFALGLIGPDASSAVKALAETAMDPQDKVAKQAIVALGRIGPKAAPGGKVVNQYVEAPEDVLGEDLIELYEEDQNKRLRYYVAMALMGMHSKDPFWIPFTRGLSAGGAPGGDHRYAEWPGYVTPRIIRELRDSRDWKVRRASAMALGEVAFTSPYDARRALENAQDDPDPRVREAVRRALEETISGNRQF